MKRLVFLSVWFMLLTLPLMVPKVHATLGTVQWRWGNMWLIGGAVLGILLLWKVGAKLLRSEKAAEFFTRAKNARARLTTRITKRVEERKTSSIAISTSLLALLLIAYPFMSGFYHTSIAITALTYIVLALGLNIILGLAGLLHIGYIAFYAVGAYTYGLLYLYFGINFWVALPIGAVVAAVFGALLSIPVLRLHGDYLAIVTLAFGEIVRLVLRNWSGLTRGPLGISGIPRPGLFGIELDLFAVTRYTYYIVLALLVLTVFLVRRLEHSRVGRQLEAMKEDIIACEAMGVNVTRAKLLALTLGSMWAGLIGVVFAARTTFINPDSFTFWESVVVLCAVVLGGIGSIPGVIIGAAVLILLPEYLRVFSDYRLLMFGALLVLMMVFRPGGLIRKRRKAYLFASSEPPNPLTSGSSSGSSSGKSSGTSPITSEA